jgi:hypothetical protein
MARARINDKVEVTCGGTTKVWRRQEAMAFFLEGALACDGSEAERYLRIYGGLQAGLRVVTDEYM